MNKTFGGVLTIFYKQEGCGYCVQRVDCDSWSLKIDFFPPYMNIHIQE